MSSAAFEAMAMVQASRRVPNCTRWRNARRQHSVAKSRARW
jgi:hypothetical protein